MGKFSDALKKTQESSNTQTSQTDADKVVKISAQEIELQKLETRPTGSPTRKKPTFDGRFNSRLVCALEPSSPVSECFKLLRSKLMVNDSGMLRRSIMVTGVQPQDGKSIISGNLAVSIAQGINHHVLLVDCDFRRPSLHKLFGIRPVHGLREYLEEGTSIAPYLIKTSLPKLTLLPAGNPVSSPSELLSSEKMRLLVQELRDRYKDRFLIIDTPPALFSAEAAPLFTMVDGVLPVVRAGKTSSEHLNELVEGIGRDRILGLVFNASTEIQKEYRYYYRHYRRGKLP